MSIKAKELPSVERLHEQFHYDIESGQIRWKAKRIGVSHGSIAGTVTPSGYITIMIDRQPVLAHRVAWKMHFGCEPVAMIDHIDGNKQNNRISNLRDVTHLQNGWNRSTRSWSGTGVKGVTFCKQTKKYRAVLRTGGKTICLGRYANIADARAAYLRAAEKAFGEFMRKEAA